MATSLQELARLANGGGDIAYGRDTKEKQIRAENFLSNVTDAAQRRAKGNVGKQNFIDFAKFATKFIPGAGPLISSAISVYDISEDAKRAKKAGAKLSAKDKMKWGGSKFEDMITQNISALDSQLKGVTKGQLKSSLINNLLGIGMNVGSLPSVDKPLPVSELRGKQDLYESMMAGTDTAAKKSGIFDKMAKKFKDKDWSELFGDKSKLNPPMRVDPGTVHTPEWLKNIVSDTDLSGVGMPDVNLGKTAKFLTGGGKGPSLFDQWKNEPWFEALAETIPGMETAVGLGKYPIGKTSATLGDAYLPGSSILNRLMTQYGDATSPAMPTHQRKSLRRRIV